MGSFADQKREIKVSTHAFIAGVSGCVLRPTIRWRHLVSTLLSTILHNSATCSVRGEQNGPAAESASVSCVQYSGIAVRCDLKCDMIP